MAVNPRVHPGLVNVAGGWSAPGAEIGVGHFALASCQGECRPKNPAGDKVRLVVEYVKSRIEQIRKQYKIVAVFDGKTPEAKRATKKAREGRGSALTEGMTQAVKKTLESMDKVAMPDWEWCRL